MVKWHSEVGVHDGDDECRVFGRGRKQVEAVTMDWDINREDRGFL